MGQRAPQVPGGGAVLPNRGLVTAARPQLWSLDGALSQEAGAIVEMACLPAHTVGSRKQPDGVPVHRV